MIWHPVRRETPSTAVQCCLESPLVGLFSLILVRCVSVPVMAAMATDVLTAWPPPSPLEQSISSTALTCFGWLISPITLKDAGNSEGRPYIFRLRDLKNT